VAIAVLSLVGKAAGYQPVAVTTGSMRPAYQPGDALVVQASGAKDVKVGDVIAFKEGQATIMVTHRVISEHTVKGNPYFRTKGDNNNAPDPDLVPHGAVYGKVVSHVPNSGRQLYWLSAWGIKFTLGALLGMIFVEEAQAMFHRARRERARRRKA
jgi:signal peptidase